MKVILRALLTLVFSAPQAMAQIDLNSGNDNPVGYRVGPYGGSPLLGGVSQLYTPPSTIGTYTPKVVPYNPGPSAPVVSVPNFAPASNYNGYNNSVPNFAPASNYSPTSIYNGYSNYGYNCTNGSAAAGVGYLAGASIVASIKISKFFLHKLAANKHEHYHPHQIDISQPDPTTLDKMVKETIEYDNSVIK